ncbi:hypothetical protein DFJ74DRAFT_59267 [Hyaloraphidium curvatum]|nr:hypothetical protein DFJ74DRAFT_59267 [Hyaloraphidium curvatum]
MEAGLQPLACCKISRDSNVLSCPETSGRTCRQTSIRRLRRQKPSIRAAPEKAVHHLPRHHDVSALRVCRRGAVAPHAPPARGRAGVSPGLPSALAPRAVRAVLCRTGQEAAAAERQATRRAGRAEGARGEVRAGRPGNGLLQGPFAAASAARLFAVGRLAGVPHGPASRAAAPPLVGAERRLVGALGRRLRRLVVPLHRRPAGVDRCALRPHQGLCAAPPRCVCSLPRRAVPDARVCDLGNSGRRRRHGRRWRHRMARDRRVRLFGWIGSGSGHGDLTFGQRATGYRTLSE